MHAERFGVEFRFRCLVDSSGYSEAVSADDQTITNLVSHKRDGGKLKTFEAEGLERHCRPDTVDSATFLADMVRHYVTQSSGSGHDCMVVDCTASPDTTPALITAVQMGAKVASANKKPFTDTQDLYDALVGASPRRLDRVRYECAVGAGLPVVNALTRTVASADDVSSISGTFSGTLGYVMTGLQNGEPFSEVVTKAKELGFTEPDPRDDLGGIDVARKALILARIMGWRMEMSDVEVKPLYPEHLADLSVQDFMASLPDLDADFAERIAAAADKGCVLRYAAQIQDGKITVKLAEVAKDSPMGRLSGTDNLVEVNTKWYNPLPLVVQGAGAGTGTTAAGVLADMVELAFTA